MKVIGQALKEARTAKQLSLEDVACNTKLNKEILSQLEHGIVPEGQHLTFVKNFIKIYSNHLGMDTQKILHRFEVYVKNENPSQLQYKGQSDSHEVQRVFKKNHAKWIVVFLIIVIFVVVWQLHLLVNQYEANTYQSKQFINHV